MVVALAECLLPQNARAGTGTITGTHPGPTPFISNVSALYSGGTLQSVAYEIVPKTGSLTRPLTASYTADYLTSTGALQGSSNSVTIPVFGLYANYTNTVYLYFYFTDGTESIQPINISTPAYADPCAQLNSPTLTQSRVNTSDLNFDYILLKDPCSVNSPTIIDTDGNIRWVGQANFGALSIALYNNGVYISDGATGINRMELTTAALTNIGNYAGAPYNVTLTDHHNIDPGRNGLIVEVNTTSQLEAADLEFDPATGAVLNFWDLGQIISYAMTQGGDNPANFVFGTASDWFHNNATTYNPADNTLIVSSRENFVIAVDYDTPSDGQKKIHWILGDTTKAWYQNFLSLRPYALTLAPSTLPPIGQHAVSIDQNGNLLLFDDGEGSLNHTPAGITRSYSAVREYEINAATMTATAGSVFYSPNPTIFNAFCGSVYDVKGNYLVDFPDANGGANLILQGLGGGENVVFNLRYPALSACTVGWNAYPLPSNVFEFSGSATSPSFNISSTPSTLTVVTPQSGQVTVNVTPQNGFTGAVTFSATGFPAGVTYSFSTPSSTIGATLSITAAAATAWGTYPITITGTSGSLVNSFTMNLVVPVPGLSLTVSGGTPQNTVASTAFPAALQATVKDANNNPLSGATVTFTAPGSGASATFGGSATVAAVTNGSGIAVSPLPVANSVLGTYSVSATVPGLPAVAFVLSNSATLSPATAMFIKADQVTQGNWQSVYGADGYNIIGDLASNPLYAAQVASGQSSYTWAPTTTDVRALQKASNPASRIAATWFSGNTFTIDTNISDTAIHQVALYCLDWDSTSRRQKVDVLDASGNVLNTQILSTSFNGGSYLLWNVSGHVQFRFTDIAGSNAVVSGLFFDTPSGPFITASAGTPQSTAVSTLFGIALQATVTDANNHPLSGITVTFSAPALGASARFGGVAAVTAVTDGSGTATSPAPVANTLAGAYAVTASVAGANAPATFNLTNTAGAPASLTVSGGTTQTLTALCFETAGKLRPRVGREPSSRISGLLELKYPN